MERDELGKTSNACGPSDDNESRSAVNSMVLDYYKKFGRKRDLEQYFSLSTAQSDIKDPSSPFWRKMKSENDSSDSGGRKSDSSHEVCRISILCSLPEPSSSQDDDTKTKTESPQTESPPIIVEEAPVDVSRHTDEDSINFDDNHSQKSLDAILDSSALKPLSPTSSITSQRKLEWDSLGDVGYANESERITSASSLSTLERLALKQQYSNNDSKQEIGLPTSQSTPLDENEGKSKIKKGLGKKTTKIFKEDVDFVEVNLPQTDSNQAPSINVNLTKHISFNVEKDGGVSVENIKRDVNISPEKLCSVAATSAPQLGMDKEIQTSLRRETLPHDIISANDPPKPICPDQKFPIMISLNTLRKRIRRKRSRVIRRKVRSKKKIEPAKEMTPQEKSGEQLSEAESFEYMPGHMYNQNQLQDNEPRPDNSTAGNKSSLESSGPSTTESSKGSKHSLTKDLEKCIDVLKVTLQKRYSDGNTKKKLIEDIVRRLLNSKYRDDESTTDFLSGLSYGDHKLGLKGNNTTSSTSDTNHSEDSKYKRPRKSILRMDKFNPNMVASTSQSAPNLFSTSCDQVDIKVKNRHTTATESDASSKGKSPSETIFPKTSSEELYLKYLEALRREEDYKRHLKDKEMFLKQKLVSSDTAFKVPIRQEANINSRIKDLMKDLTRNNYDDGSGDASKLEGGSSNLDLNRPNALRNLRSHSVFTLSSSHSEGAKRPNLKKKQAERELAKAGTSRDHYCCCPHHYTNTKVGYADSSVQVNIKYECEDTVSHVKTSPRKAKPSNDCRKCKPECSKNTRVIPDDVTGEIKYICCCNTTPVSSSDMGHHIKIYKCSKLTHRGVQIEDPSRIYNTGVQCNSINNSDRDKIELIQAPGKLNSATESTSSGHSSNARRYSRSSQTNILSNINSLDAFDNFYSSESENKYLCGKSTKMLGPANADDEKIIINEATRCLQTEISINPKISDPNLSDISIVNNSECAKLIAENIRLISQRNSNSVQKKTSSVCTNSLSGKMMLSSKSELREEFVRDTNYGSFEQISKDQTPDQVTNMRVSTIDSNLEEVPVHKEQIHKSIGTVKVGFADECTSLDEECSKSSQCMGALNNNKIIIAEPSHKFIETHVVNTDRSVLDPTYNTYPKKDIVKEKPPLKRFNTDTDKVSVCSSVQTDIFKGSNKLEKTTFENRPVKNIDKLAQDDTPLINLKSRLGSVQDMASEANTISLQNIQNPSSTEEIRHIGVQKDTFAEETEKTNVECSKVSPKIYENETECKKNDAQDSSHVSKNITQSSKICLNICTKEKDQGKEYCPNPCNKEGLKFCMDCANIRKKDIEKSDNICPDLPIKDVEKEIQDWPTIAQKEDEQCRMDIEKRLKHCPADVKKDVEQGDKNSSAFVCPDIYNKDIFNNNEESSNICQKIDGQCCIHSYKKDTQQGNNNSRNIIQKEDQSSNDCFDKYKKDDDLLTKNLPNVYRKDIEYCCYGCRCTHKKNDGQEIKESPLEKPCNYPDMYKNIDTQSRKDIQNPKKNFSSETEPEAKINKRSCIACQTDIPETKIPEVCDPRSKITRNIQKEFHSQVHATFSDPAKDAIVDLIQDITRRYSKHNILKIKKKKCFNEIMTVLNYLLDTDESTDPEPKTSTTSETKSSSKPKKHKLSEGECSDKPIDKSCQMPTGSHKDSKHCIESSDLPCSSEIQTSSDSTACKVLRRIKKECEKFHQKRCKGNRKCEVSSSTSVNCEKCKKTHHCSCRYHKCKRSKALEKLQKKCIAYNLIIQTSESMVSEDPICVKKSRPLHNVVVKVPKKNIGVDADSNMRRPSSPIYNRNCGPRDSESTDEYARKCPQTTIREYLEQNRPDFVEKTSQRQHCMKFIREKRATDRAAHRDLLSLHVEQQPDLTALSSDELRKLAQEIGLDLRRKKISPKFISERDMKKHSENIYKTLPEVMKKKEEKKKENIKKTNLLMANIFKKNLQKQALRGSVNLSNYTNVIKI